MIVRKPEPNHPFLRHHFETVSWGARRCPYGQLPGCAVLMAGTPGLRGSRLSRPSRSGNGGGVLGLGRQAGLELHRDVDEFRNRTHMQFLHDVRAMGLDGPFAGIER